MQSMCPVRELEPGERPRDWAQDESPAQGESGSSAPVASPAPARVEAERGSEIGAEPTAEPTFEAPPPSGPQRYKVQFTASEEYVSLVERAQALLAHALPGGSLEEIHLRALRALVTELEKRKYGAGTRPRAESAAESPGRASPRADRRRSVPAAVRRAVFEQHGARCSYVDDRGQRCRETRFLELHHLEPFALGGADTESNLTLVCKAHNTLAAEADFGRAFMVEKSESRHEKESESHGTSSVRYSADRSADLEEPD
jgi:hypothetical protein